MDVQRAHLVRLADKIAGYCGVCGAAGNHKHADYDLHMPICDECTLPLLNAENALVAFAHCAQPGEEGLEP